MANDAFVVTIQPSDWLEEHLLDRVMYLLCSFELHLYNFFMSKYVYFASITANVTLYTY